MTIEGAMPDFAVKQYLLSNHVFAVDMPKNGEIARTSLQRKCDSQGVTVCPGKVAVFRHKIERSSLFEGG